MRDPAHLDVGINTNIGFDNKRLGITAQRACPKRRVSNSIRSCRSEHAATAFYDVPNKLKIPDRRALRVVRKDAPL
ncbi:hypothetical protein [Bradyrhizobium sp. ARR65]|uniref:hypothetical protein n=1 Tax=Bradyrhizobium sp. ARR65 TaxID=1040989 RepID=UPI0012F9A98F|nr:hypothetical protein [Bradyrhizobium sp. ARR65]